MNFVLNCKIFEDIMSELNARENLQVGTRVPRIKRFEKKMFIPF